MQNKESALSAGEGKMKFTISTNKVEVKIKDREGNVFRGILDIENPVYLKHPETGKDMVLISIEEGKAL